jgi:hypothetical protein
VGAMSETDAVDRMHHEALVRHKAAGVLDPLLSTLAGFNSPAELKGHMKELFHVLASSDTTTIDFDSMARGLQQLDYDPPIVLSTEDWEAITRGGALLNRAMRMDLANFEIMMRIQLGEYSQRLLAIKMSALSHSDSDMCSYLLAGKMAFLEITEAALERRNASALQVLN